MTSSIIRYKKIYFVKDFLFIFSLLPIIYLGYGFYYNKLGSNPIEMITKETGIWCLRFLLITLLMTPIKYIFKYNFAIQLRRMFGLYAYFYGSLHMIIYIGLDQFFDIASIWRDIQDRPFITVGFLSMLLMTPLALTSFDWAIRKMGGKNWKFLHKTVYFVAILGCLHYLWLVKISIKSPIIYLSILIFLLIIRIFFMIQKKSRKTY